MPGAEAIRSPVPSEGERATRAIALGLVLGLLLAVAAGMRRHRRT